ncbi:MAG: sodium ion-translocating decarboxylase subunit beta [Clostridia bacterium]|nr:sodium ion-translocating decarboxylase subunit beta [Clostridia bacterium]
MSFAEILRATMESSGFAALTVQQAVMLGISLVLFYLAIVKKFEPLLLVPIAFGMMLANLPGAGLMFDARAAAEAELAAARAALEAGSGSVEAVNAAAAALAEVHWYDSGLLRILYSGVKSSVFPCLIFLGIGAMTDFSPLLSNPVSLLLGGGAQFGIYVAFVTANGLGQLFEVGGDPLFTAAQAAAIAIIGGADGPTAIFLASIIAPELLGPIAVAAYSYMALIPMIQPPIMRMLTTEEERRIKMPKLREVSKAERVVFPILVTVFCVLLLPATAPLIGMLMLGNLFRECGVTERLSETAQGALTNIVTILLGTSVGATADGATFLQPQTLVIVALGLVAFSFSTAGGLLLGKLLCKLSGGKINPLIGAAGVSAVPMAARVAQVEGSKADPTNFLLMHAMGPNVAGVIGSAVAAGFLLLLFG